jgi:hypothetical protein
VIGNGGSSVQVSSASDETRLELGTTMAIGSLDFGPVDSPDK